MTWQDLRTIGGGALIAAVTYMALYFVGVSS